MKHFIWSLIIALGMPKIYAQQYTPTLYLSPDGNDQNDGLSDKTPLKSVDAGLQKVYAIRKADPDKKILVYLKPGIYSTSQPLLIRSNDIDNSHSEVTFTSDPNNKAIISGGRQITGWEKWKRKIWRSYIPDVKAGTWSFNEVWVNGDYRSRARIPNNGFYRVAGFPGKKDTLNYYAHSKKFEFASDQFNPNWKNLKDIDVIVYHFWIDSHMRVDTVDSESKIVSFQNESGAAFTDGFSSIGARYIIENVFEGLDSAGEWYLDKSSGYIYYMPLPGEEPDKFQFIAPITERFIEMKGDPEKNHYIENFTFENIKFEYTNYQLPKSNSRTQASSSVSAAIRIEGSKNCTFKNCIIENIGNYAFEILNGSSFNNFIFNNIHNIGAGGFHIDGGTVSSSPLTWTNNQVISDNVIANYGEVFPSAAGILLMNAFDNKIIHNLIHHGWYTAISVGWSWGYQRSISTDNLIAYNHIYTIGQGLLSDMGGIYTLGVSPGTILKNNLIHDIDAYQYGGWGIYNDEGSAYILIENNIVYNTKNAGHNIHYGKEITVRNNIFALGHLQEISRGSMESHISVFFENNIVYWENGIPYDGNWNDKSFEFYSSPRVNGTLTLNTTFITNWNLYFNPNLNIKDVRFFGQTWDEWRKRGKDTHSLYSDPLFKDPGHYDFKLLPNSPAFSLGFKQIDMSQVGPRNNKN